MHGLQVAHKCTWSRVASVCGLLSICWLVHGALYSVAVAWWFVFVLALCVLLT